MSTYYVPDTVWDKMVGKDRYTPYVYYSSEEETTCIKYIHINVKLEEANVMKICYESI